MADIKHRIGLQSCKYNGYLLEEEVAFSISKGFKVFEVFFDDFWPWDINVKLREIIKEVALENDLALQVHAPIKRVEPWNEVLLEAVSFTSEIGSELLTFHPEIEDIHFYKEIFSLAMEKKIYIGLENYKAHGSYYTPEELKQITDEFQNFPNIGITFDTGHANIGTKPHEYLTGLIENGLKIFNVHLHDNLGKTDSHLPLGQGNIRFSDLIHIFDKINYNGNFIIEHWDGNVESARYFYTLWKRLVY